MDEEAKQLLREEVALARENNKVLHKLLRYQCWSRWFGIIKWIIIVGSAIGAFYYLQPLVNNLWSTYSELLGTVSDFSVKSLPR